MGRPYIFLELHGGGGGAMTGKVPEKSASANIVNR